MREELARLVSLHKTAEAFCNRPVKDCEVQTTLVKEVAQKAKTAS
ncbi:hypothetical protein AWZ03_014621, partial [Drosophila navojoa]